MGAGIAQLAATHGCAVHLIDVNGEVLERAVESVGARLARKVEKDRLDSAERDAILNRIHPGTTVAVAGDVDLAIEAVTEDLALKQRIFRSLEEVVSDGAVLATNTSSLCISAIAEATRRPQRVVGMHFFNPAPVMPLVEIIAGKQSGDDAVKTALGAARAWGKTPVVAKDTPGFIVNRVARGYSLEALRLLGEGVAGVDEIDQVMRTHGGFKMGPFELMDLVGLDVNLAVSTSVWQQMDRSARFAPHEIQQQLVKEGWLGRKTQRGFYRYNEAAAVPAWLVNRKSFVLSPLFSGVLHAFAERSGAIAAGTTEQFILGRILTAIFNEAAMALGAEVASREDIDTAMIKGTNYPRGPLAWANEIGYRTVRGVLKALNEMVADGRYEPAALFTH